MKGIGCQETAQCHKTKESNTNRNLGKHGLAPRHQPENKEEMPNLS